MPTLPELIKKFKLFLGKVNVSVCTLDSLVAEALDQALKTGAPERQLEAWALKQEHHLHFETVPDVHAQIASFGIVFLHQAIESFYEDFDTYLKERGSYAVFDPLGSDAHPEGEDPLRRLLRKLDLINTGAREFPNYSRETKTEWARREALYSNTLEELEFFLMDYYRLVRNGAVHYDAAGLAENHYQTHFDAKTLEKVLDRAKRQYQLVPNHPDSLAVGDVVLFSKVMQNVTRKLVILGRPDLGTEVLPYLQNEFARYNDAARRRNAIIGALRSDYLLDLPKAEAYADGLMTD